MNRAVAKFSKVSRERWAKDYMALYEGNGRDPEELRAEALSVYEELMLPRRATRGSAGYDIYSPVEFVLAPGEEIKVATGLRCRMDEDAVLLIVPRSSLGFKYRFQLNNTIRVIDSDYYYSDNEGHIFIRFTNDSKTGAVLHVSKGQAIAQGIFVHYGITEDDDTEAVRNGGLGSTDAGQKEAGDVVSRI